jgi:hypothetical protein
VADERGFGLQTFTVFVAAWDFFFTPPAEALAGRAVLLFFPALAGGPTQASFAWVGFIRVRFAVADFFPVLAFFASAFAIDSASQSFFLVAPLADAFRLLFHSAEP